MALSLAIGCSGGTGTVDLRNGVTQPTTRPTAPGSAGPSTGPTGTAAPTLGPTAGPTLGPTAMPTPFPTGGLTCAASAAAIPGTYTTIFSQGNVAGSTYTQTVGTWFAETYTAATPAPTPTATITAGPTASPTTTPTPVTYILYTGVYSVPAFTGTNPTQGCFILLTRADGMPISPPATNNAFADGTPRITTLVNATLVSNGAISTFTIAGLSASAGSGSFTLDNGAAGTATIQASQMITFARAQRLLDRSRRLP